jgi:hypothetical protein
LNLCSLFWYFFQKNIVAVLFKHWNLCSLFWFFQGKYNYIVVIGRNEMEEDTVSVRSRGAVEEQRGIKTDDFLKDMLQKIQDKVPDPPPAEDNNGDGGKGGKGGKGGYNFFFLLSFFKKILLPHLNIELMFTFLVLFSRERRERWDTKRQGWERRRGDRFGLDQDGHSCGHHCESVAPPRFGQIVVRGDRHRGGHPTTDRFRVARVLPGRGDDDWPSLFGGVQPETGQTGRV